MRWFVLICLCGCAGAPSTTPRAAPVPLPVEEPLPPEVSEVAVQTEPEVPAEAPAEAVDRPDPEFPRGPRVIRRRGSYSTMPDGTEHPPPPEVPTGFVRYDPEGLSPSLAGPV